MKNPMRPNTSSRSALTRVLLWGLLLGAIFYGLMVPFFGMDRLLRAGYTLSLLLLSGIGFALLRFGRERSAGAVPVLGVTAVLVSALWGKDGAPVVYAGFVVGVMMVALLYGTRWALLYGLGALTLGFFPMVLHPAIPEHASPLNDWIGYGVYFIVAAMLAGFAVRSLERSRENEVREILGRQTAERDLAARRIQLDLVFEASEAAAWEWNGQGLRWEGPVGRLLGLPREPATLPDFLSRVSPEDRPALATEVGIGNPGATAFVKEFRHMNFEGTTHWFETRGRIERDDGGRPVKILATVVNIDHRKIREAQARHEENLIRDLVSELEVGVLSFDGDLRPTIWNQRAVETLGERDGLAGFWMIPLEGEDGRPILADRNPVRLCLRSGEPMTGILRRREGNPPSPWLAFRCHRKRLTGTGEPGVILTLQDISDLRGMERALQETEKSWFSLLTDVPDHILSLDPSGRILWTNRKSGRAPLSPTGTLKGWLPEATVVEMDRALAKAFAEGTSVGLECEGPGGVRWDCHLSPVERGGAVVACFLFARDVSRGFKAELALRERQEQLRIAFEANPDGLALVGPDGLIREWNPRLTVLTGRPDLAEVHWADLSTGNDRGAVMEAMGRLLRGESAVERAERAWGPKWVQERLSPVRNPAGETVALMAQVEDITTPRRTARSIAESEGRLRRLMEGLPFGLHFYQREESGQVVLTGFNPMAESLLDLDHGGLVGRAFGEGCSDLNRPALIEAMDRVFSGGAHESIPDWACRRHEIPGMFHLHLFSMGEGRLAILFQDVGDWHRSGVEREGRLSRLENRLEQLPVALLNLDGKGAILEGNREARAKWGGPSGDLRGRAFSDLLLPDGASRWEAMAHALSGGRVLDFESLLEGGAWYRVRLARAEDGTCSVLALPKPEPREASPVPQGSDRDGTRGFLSGLEDALERPGAGGGCLVLLEMESFREVETSLGTEMAEAMAERVREALRPGVEEAGSDGIHRLGPSTLGIVIPAVPVAEGQRLSARWLAVVAELSTAEPSPLTSLSAAVVAIPAEGRDARSLYRAARHALAAARDEGLPVAVYRPERDRGLSRRRRILADLPGALDQEAFHLDVQGAHALPLTSPSQPEWVELFLRWHHPLEGELGPGEFIPLASWAGLGNDLAALMFRLGSRALSAWSRGGYRGHLHFNLGEQLACDLALPEALARWCAEGNLDPRRVGLEIPEWAVARDPLHAATVMERLSRRGHPVWLDDYGVLPLPFPRLADLEITGIKLAPALTRGLPGNGRLRALVSSLSLTCRSLDLTLCAKGVEDPETIPLLASLGVVRVQGHATGVPRPAGPNPPSWP